MKDNTLLDIFLTQADSALRSLQDEKVSAKHRQRELEDLQGAAELMGDSLLEGRVAALIRSLQGGSDTAELRALIDELRPTRQEPTHAARPKPPPPARRRAETAGDSSPTQVKKSVRRRSSKFDTSEHMTLLNFFREEARESLDRITAQLLAASKDKPAEEVLHELMRLTHGLKGAAGTVDLPVVAELTHDYESAFENIRNGSIPWSTELRNQLVEIADRLRLIITDTSEPYASSSEADELKEFVASIGTSKATFDRAETSPLLVTESTRADTFEERRRPDRRGADSPMLRVDPSRIDHLMNSVGELVFDRTRIEKRVSELGTELSAIQQALSDLSATRASWVSRDTPVRADQLGSALSDLETSLVDRLPLIDAALERLKSDTQLLRRTEFALQDGLTGVRMQSVRSIFQRLTPQLRSIARQADKQVRLVTAGGETEFDKTVADQMVDPLIQLLRNSVAHGIESPELRELRGKSSEGRIMVTARHEGNVVVLEVSDDGAGIDTIGLRRRLVESGEWSASKAEQASDERVLQRIFEAGYSSRASTDQLAGRGVGLSAVRQTVTRLGGEVLVATVPQRGTTFTMRLPLTTAIANALLFKIGGHVFAIPNVHVLDQGSIDLPLEATTQDAAGHELPLVPLHELLGFELPENAENCAVVLIEYLGKRLAISCDRIVGPREIVVKNLGPLLAGIQLYAGATISPSGKVQLILDPAALVSIANPSDQRSSSALLKSDRVAKRVLVVDDSKAIREAMRHMLQRAGYDVLTASDGRSAWHTIQEQGCDVLVTDLEMPGESGFDLLTRLRGDQRFASLPALVISSKASDENREQAAKLRASDFLPKPVSQADLVDALRAAQRESK